MQHNVQLSVNDGRIEARTPFALKDVCKSIAGRKWNPKRKVWTWEATPDNARDVYAAFREFARADIERDAEMAKLILKAEVNREEAIARKQKIEGDLAQPEVRTLDQWRHQLEGYHFAEDRRGSMLAMGMGCGKTKTSIDLEQNWGDVRRILILAPLEVVRVWPHQFELHSAAPVEVVALDDRKMRVDKKAAIAKKRVELADAQRRVVAVVVNYESAWRPAFEKFAMKTKWDVLICDESHKLKSATGKASRFVAKLAKQCRKVVALTGTPMSQSPLDIFGQARFIDPSIFGTSVTAFKHKYFSFGEHNQITGFAGPAARAEFTERCSRFMYQVSRDVLDLPDAMDEVRTVDLSDEAVKAYVSLQEEFIAEVKRGEIVTASNALVKLLRLQEITGGFVHIDDIDDIDQAKAVRDICEAKSSALAELIDDMGTEPVVVFARFRRDLERIHDAAKKAGRDSLEVSGTTKQLQEWQRGDAQVLAVQIQAGGVGIDLTRARYCVYYSKSFSLTDYDQSRARVHRPGQERPVTYYHLNAVIATRDAEGNRIEAPTIDGRIHDALQNKQDAVTSIMKEVQEMNA